MTEGQRNLQNILNKRNKRSNKQSKKRFKQNYLCKGVGGLSIIHKLYINNIWGVVNPPPGSRDGPQRSRSCNCHILMVFWSFRVLRPSRDRRGTVLRVWAFGRLFWEDISAAIFWGVDSTTLRDHKSIPVTEDRPGTLPDRPRTLRRPIFSL